jgi:general secretion pathway protein G
MDDGCEPNVTLLSGAGNLPAGLGEAGFDTDVASSYDSHFSADVNGCYAPNWKGPYMALVAADPWGNTYITNAGNFPVEGQPVWILSAGPNKRMDTTANSATLLGDDIGLRMK